ncbi:hypothetical protein EAI_00337 [Harpegnathos saltator]|uniref:Uncharacterized protein n=1 Tax=Harpegnathos saltator TaxID=610380 RepID=E2C1B7_HARSA|nr:hypothetical protein EAI_00337 [Harpegnathos saltator]
MHVLEVPQSEWKKCFENWFKCMQNLPTRNAKFLFQTLRETSPADADAAPEDPVRAEQGRPGVVAESNSNLVDADAAPEDPVRAKQSRLEELKRNVAGSDCKSFRFPHSAPAMMLNDSIVV